MSGIGLLGVGSQIRHPKFGDGVVVSLDLEFYKIFFHEGDLVKTIARDYEGMEVLEKKEADASAFDPKDMEIAIENAVKRGYREMVETLPKVPIANKWLHGKVEIKAVTADLQSKEIPIEALFHKIVMVRDRLRVLEQNINTHPKLDDADRLNLQQYITRSYGSLTTFNVLFANKDDQFKGTGGEK